MIENGSRGLVTVEQAIEKRILSYNRAFSDNTNRARKADFKVYKAWCEERGVSLVPAEPVNIEQFLWNSMGVEDYSVLGEVKDRKGDPVITPLKSVATVERYLATLKYLHHVSSEINNEFNVNANYDPQKDKNPVDTLLVRSTLKSIKREFNLTPQQQADPILIEHLKQIFDVLGDSRRHLLYKALISVAFDSMLRCSELVRIRVEHITANSNGAGRVYIPFHKTDPDGKGSYRYLSSTSIRYINAWREASKIQSGLLFRSLTYNWRREYVLKSMSKSRVAKIYKEVGELCGFKVENISAHSTRVGAAQELLKNGATLASLMHAGDWKSEAMPVRYAAKLDVDKGAMADLAKSSGRS